MHASIASYRVALKRKEALRRWATAVVALGALVVGPYVASATPLSVTQGPFTVTFYNAGDSDPSGQSSSQTWTDDQKNSVLASINTWASRIDNTEGRPIELHCFWSDLSGNTLGGASSPITGNGTHAWTFTELVWREGVNYTRPADSYSDATIVYDTTDAGGNARNWYFGTESPTSGQIDFRSVVTHEIGHLLGFSSSYVSGTDTFWEGGITAWDSHLIDSHGVRPRAGQAGTSGDFDELDNPVFFDGVNAMAANGNSRIEIYAPPTWAGGSSLAHLNTNSPVFAGDLMSHSIGAGVVRREPSDYDWAIMKDLGWNILAVQSVPEPSTIVMLIGGGCVGVIVYRRRGFGG